MAASITPITAPVGLAVLDACRDAANEWVFTDLGAPWTGIKATYIAGTEHATHFVDVTGTIDRGVASLREHRAYIDGLGTDFDPDEFLRTIAGYGGMAAGCEYAVLLQAFNAFVAGRSRISAVPGPMARPSGSTRWRAGS